MDKIKENNQRRQRRHAKVRAKISGTSARPRLSVFRSNAGLYLQLIDDENGHTLASASTLEIKDKSTKVEKSKKVGTVLAQKAKDLRIIKVVFDRGAYRYHGRVKAAAEGAREGGLQF